MEEKKITIDEELIVRIHNGLVQMHPTGEDIITVASIIMDLRRTLEENHADS